MIYLYNKEKTYFFCQSVSLSVCHHFALTGKSSGQKTVFYMDILRLSSMKYWANNSMSPWKSSTFISL